MRRRTILASIAVAWQSVRPRNVAVLVALAVVAGAFSYAISEEVPVGRVRGQVRLIEDNRSLAGGRVSLTPIETEGDEEDHVRHAGSRGDGRFTLAQAA